MTKQPEALRIADVLIGSSQFTGTPIWQAADMLRRQHEAIKQLRESLTECARFIHPMYYVQHRAEQALKDTEGEGL